MSAITPAQYVNGLLSFFTSIEENKQRYQNANIPSNLLDPFDFSAENSNEQSQSSITHIAEETVREMIRFLHTHSRHLILDNFSMQRTVQLIHIASQIDSDDITRKIDAFARLNLSNPKQQLEPNARNDQQSQFHEKVRQYLATDIDVREYQTKVFFPFQSQLEGASRPTHTLLQTIFQTGLFLSRYEEDHRIRMGSTKALVEGFAPLSTKHILKLKISCLEKIDKAYYLVDCSLVISMVFFPLMIGIAYPEWMPSMFFVESLWALCCCCCGIEFGTFALELVEHTFRRYIRLKKDQLKHQFISDSMTEAKSCFVQTVTKKNSPIAPLALQIHQELTQKNIEHSDDEQEPYSQNGLTDESRPLLTIDSNENIV
jgi:hypothetical protein